jgi:hypothetical protein
VKELASNAMLNALSFHRRFGRPSLCGRLGPAGDGARLWTTAGPALRESRAVGQTGPTTFGGGATERFDVLGQQVNTAATLTRPGVTLSTEAFRKLGPEARRRFKKHTAPITYIRQDDPHRLR